MDKSEKFNWFVRVGYFSRAILYTMLGLVALTSVGAISDGTEGIFRAIENFPAGVAILWIMAIGLTFYGLFRLCSTFFDIENNGSDAKGWGKRIGHAGSAIGHFVLAWTAYQLASNSGSGGSGGAQDSMMGILGTDLGGTVLGLLGLVFFIVAIYQFKKGLTGEFMTRVSPSAPDVTRWLGGAGFSARGVVYGIIGWSLVKAGFLSGGEEITSLAGALSELAGQGWLFTLTAIGLLLFGLFSLILSRYRIIPDLD